MLVDDGSQDSGREIALEYARLNPSRIYYLAHPGRRNLGMCTARNLGVRHSKGQYVAVLDSDDVWLPRKLEEQTALMQRYPEVGLIYGHSEYWYDWAEDIQLAGKNYIPDLAPSGRVYQPPELLKLCNQLGPMGQPCPSDFLLRRLVVDQIGGFEEAFDPEHQLYEDQAFLTKIYLHVPVFVADECWDRYRIHDESWGAVSDKQRRTEATRKFYFGWLEAYLRQCQVQDEEIWKAYWRCTRYYRHPWLGTLARGVRPAVTALRSVARSQEIPKSR
jgi:glycosyltransferase involved in cell wall biosynthesis